jgi:hypothetical protein
MDLKQTIDSINTKWESTFASAEEEVREEVFNQISNYEEIMLSARLYHVDGNRFGFEVELDATDHISMEEVQEVGKDEFDDENYFLEWVVNEYEGKLYDWADEKYDGGFPDDITEAIVEAEGPLSYCMKRLIWNGEEVWKEED